MTSVESGSATSPIRVEIWSDVVCPWCYIGKRRFEAAAEQLAGEIDLDVSYRPYQLDPRATPGTTQPVFDAYARKFGGPDQAQAVIDRVTEAAAGDGLEFRMDLALRANTLLAHRLLWWAEEDDAPFDQHELKERLLRAYFIEGVDIGDPEALADLSAEVGADRDAVLAFLDTERGRDEVAQSLNAAADHGITGVPTYVVNGQWAIPGAQDPDTFVNVLRRLNDKLQAEAAATVVADGTDGAVCADDACDV